MMMIMWIYLKSHFISILKCTLVTAFSVSSYKILLNVQYLKILGSINWLILMAYEPVKVFICDYRE